IRVFGDRVQPGQDLASTRGFITEALQKLGEAARPLGVEVWIESHGDFARAADTLGLLRGIGSPAVGVLWDPANAFEAGEAGGSRVHHVHLKDVGRVAGARGTERAWAPRLPGRGDFGPAAVLALLRDRGYGRWVSFEWEKRWHPDIEEPEVALPYFARWAAAVL